MQLKNIGLDEKLGILTEKRFSIHNGHPVFDNKYTDVNARELAENMISHNYREGWSL